MPCYTYKLKGKYKIARIINNEYQWTVELPRPTPPAKMDWRQALRDIAGRAGYAVTFDHGSATLTPTGSEHKPAVICSNNRPGDWKATLCLLIDDIMTGRLPILSNKTPSTIFPPVPDAPTAPGLADGFDPMTLSQAESLGTQTSWLRVIGSVPYSKAMRLGSNTPSVADVCLHGQKTGLLLIECACGRLFVGTQDTIDGLPRYKRNNCGCLDEPSTLRARLIWRAWREWCTINLVGETPCALRDVLTAAGYSTTCDLRMTFPDFFKLFSKMARETNGGQIIQRLDPRQPFAVGNLKMCEGKRALLTDPNDPDLFKISI